MLHVYLAVLVNDDIAAGHRFSERYANIKMEKKKGKRDKPAEQQLYRYIYLHICMQCARDAYTHIYTKRFFSKYITSITSGNRCVHTNFLDCINVSYDIRFVSRQNEYRSSYCSEKGSKRERERTDLFLCESYRVQVRTVEYRWMNSFRSFFVGGKFSLATISCPSASLNFNSMYGDLRFPGNQPDSRFMSYVCVCRDMLMLRRVHHTYSCLLYSCYLILSHAHIKILHPYPIFCKILK